MANKNQPQRGGAVGICDSPELSRIAPEVTEAIKHLAPKQRDKIIQAVRRESFSGPIPHPELLQGYDKVKQGFAERIVAMAEVQQKHRFECERRMIDGTVAESKRGQWMAFIIAILFLTGSITLGILGHDWLGGVVGGGTLISLVTVFISGRKREKQD